MPAPIRYILLLALLNPAVLIVGAMLGRRADQPQKLVIAGFIAGIAGAAFAGLLMWLGLTGAAGPRLLAGVLIAGAVFGTAVAWLGWRTRRT